MTKDELIYVSIGIMGMVSTLVALAVILYYNRQKKSFLIEIEGITISSLNLSNLKKHEHKDVKIENASYHFTIKGNECLNYQEYEGSFQKG